MSETTQTAESNNKPETKKFISYGLIVNNIPFVLFLVVLAVVYIYNGHQADKLIKKISTTEKNIKELEFEYKTLKSEVIFRSKASELAKAIEPMGLKELRKAPEIIAEDSSSHK